MNSISNLSPFLAYYIRNLYREFYSKHDEGIKLFQIDFIKLEEGIEQLKNDKDFTKINNLQI
ncbi:MAG: hypothetical protein WCD18_16575, partial [Thermosynechococcaceae cyanobacterium]